MKKFNKNSIMIALALSLAFGFAGPATVSAAGPATVNLLSAGDFVILSKTAITTTGATLITGDLGISPALSTDTSGFGLVLDGSGTFSTSALVTGSIFAADYAVPTPATLTAAISAMEAAYTDANGRAVDVTDAGAGNLAGLTLVPGTYFFSGPGNVTITGDVILSGGANDVWIFQIPGTLNISASQKVLLSGGAQASNIFWAVAGTTTLQPGSTFEGNILGGPGASTIAMQSGAILNGRALGQTDVTLIANTIGIPVLYVAPAPVPEPTPVPVNGVSPGGSGSSHSSRTDSPVSSPAPTAIVAQATVAPVVTAIIPSFPNAGLSPEEGNASWSIIVLVSMFVAAAVSLGIVLKKKTI
ncbi:MAG: ice-binding family protein [Candidatus Paceibacterota bacterium]